MNVESNKKEEKKENFEENLKGLEEIISQLERGDLPLDVSLERYEEGIRKLRRCYAILEEAEKKVMILTRDGEGNLKEVPFHYEKGGKAPLDKPPLDNGGSHL